jgi:4'-phosphopantetheinyl transferase
MIHWLVQSLEAHPDLLQGLAPAGLLSPAEVARFHALKSAKRRRDWLLGRWTAKQLLRQVMARDGSTVALDAIVVDNDDSGAPVVNDPPFSLSISHSHGYAFCAAVAHPAWPLGADLEWIVPRASTFASDFFTEAEAALVARAPAAARDVLMTAIWSAKEAALKALHLGLRVDTRTVACLVEPVPERPPVWTPFAISWDAQRLDRPAPPLAGWWRVSDNFVLTLVTQREV